MGGSLAIRRRSRRRRLTRLPLVSCNSSGCRNSSCRTCAARGQILVQRAILKHEADRMNLQVSDEDLRRELQTGPFAQYLFPNGKYIGDDAYINFVPNAFEPVEPCGLRIAGEERHGAAASAGSDYGRGHRLRQCGARGLQGRGTKVKFDYVVISADDLRKAINPSDADLQAFFKSNAARYATAIPETRKIQYVSFDASNLPGGKPQVTDADVQAYYNAHQGPVRGEGAGEDAPHSDRGSGGRGCEDRCGGEGQGRRSAEADQGGRRTLRTWRAKNSDDPGSKTQGGELPMYPTSGLDPAYAKAAMALNPGQTSDLVKSHFGYHIIQTEEKKTAHTKPLAEVKAEIVPVLEQQRAGAAEQTFASQLAADAKKNGLDKAAAAQGAACGDDRLRRARTV